MPKEDSKDAGAIAELPLSQPAVSVLSLQGTGADRVR